jgi:hypothetical protein
MRRGGRWLTARLMYAGRNRSSAIRRKVPWTKSAHGIGHSLNGDQFCGGGAPAHGGVLARAQQVPGASSKIVHFWFRRSSRPTRTRPALGRWR